MIIYYVLIGIALGMLWVNRGNVIAFIADFFGEGKEQKILHLYNLAYKLGGISLGNKIKYAYLTLKLGNLDEAGKIFSLISMESMTPEQKNNLMTYHAVAYWEKGDAATAIEMLKEVAENMPTTLAYRNLGLFCNYNGNLSDALSYNVKAYEYNSSSPAIVENLAYTYYLLGDRKNAQKYYVELMKMKPTSPDSYFRYGQLLVELGYVQDGLNMVKEALKQKFSFMTLVTKEEIEEYLAKYEGTQNE